MTALSDSDPTGIFTEGWLAYPELSGRMPAPIGPQSDLANVDRSALLVEGVAMGLLHAEAAEALHALATARRSPMGKPRYVADMTVTTLSTGSAP